MKKKVKKEVSMDELRSFIETELSISMKEALEKEGELIEKKIANGDEDLSSGDRKDLFPRANAEVLSDFPENGNWGKYYKSMIPFLKDSKLYVEFNNVLKKYKKEGVKINNSLKFRLAILLIGKGFCFFDLSNTEKHLERRLWGLAEK